MPKKSESGKKASGKGGNGVEDAAAVAIAAQTAQDQAHHDVIISEASSVRVAIGDVESSINSAADRSVAATNTVKGAIVAVRGAVESTSATEVAAMLDVKTAVETVEVSVGAVKGSVDALKGAVEVVDVSVGAVKGSVDAVKGAVEVVDVSVGTLKDSVGAVQTETKLTKAAVLALAVQEADQHAAQLAAASAVKTSVDAVAATVEAKSDAIITAVQGISGGGGGSLDLTPLMDLLAMQHAEHTALLQQTVDRLDLLAENLG